MNIRNTKDSRTFRSACVIQLEHFNRAITKDYPFINIDYVPVKLASEIDILPI